MDDPTNIYDIIKEKTGKNFNDWLQDKINEKIFEAETELMRLRGKNATHNSRRTKKKSKKDGI